MNYTPRRPFDDDMPSYLESDNDYVNNNRSVAVALLDILPELLVALNTDGLCVEERIDSIYAAFEKSDILDELL